MKNIALLGVLLITGLSNAQSRPIRIEVEDMTQVRMLAAQYDRIQSQKNNQIQQEFQSIKNDNLIDIGRNLNNLMKQEYSKQSPDKKIIKEIESLQKDNNFMLDIRNNIRYKKKLDEITYSINNLTLKINAQK